MLSSIVLRLITVIGTQCTGLELITNLRGIVCLEKSPSDYRLDQASEFHKLSLAPTGVLISDKSSPNVRGKLEDYASAMPVTVLFGNDAIRDQHIRETFSWLPQFTMAFAPLDDKVSDRLTTLCLLLTWLGLSVHLGK
jgi:hypothetical protein